MLLPCTLNQSKTDVVILSFINPDRKKNDSTSKINSNILHNDFYVKGKNCTASQIQSSDLRVELKSHWWWDSQKEV